MIRFEPMVSVAPNRRFKVLLADESEGWHQTVSGLLHPQGVETLLARSGNEALEILKHEVIHVVVVDQSMPGLGGLQVIKRMQSQFDNIPPTILLANQLTHNLMHEALAMQVFSVLGKPVDFNLLLDSLARVVKRHYEGRWPS